VTDSSELCPTEGDRLSAAAETVAETAPRPAVPAAVTKATATAPTGTGATAGPSRRERLALIGVLGALSALGPLSIDLYLPAFPALADDLGSRESSIQLTLTACLAGLALGQAFVGPLSDALGRRRPLLVGLVLYGLASVVCALAPSTAALVAGRFLQGLAGAAGVVIARAVVRDLHTGSAAARFFSRLMLVTGLAPILAPVLGAELLRFTSWRGVFWVLAVVGVLLLGLVAVGLRETLPVARRRDGSLRDTARTYAGLATDRVFMGYALSGGLAFAALFAYISGSSFVLQDMYGITPQGYALLFGVNSLGLTIMSQVNGRLVDRVPLRTLLRSGMIVTAVGGVLAVAVAATGFGGLTGIATALFLVASGIGFVMPNSTALALADHPEAAGTASALLGALQFVVGAVAAPLVGAFADGTALPMAVVIAVAGVGGLAALGVLTRPRPTAPTPALTPR
jgi:DHA1 family bicyclomycin/chloramphenicol resistance-like MFS transporter